MPAPAPPEAVDTVLAAAAQGASCRQAARLAGVGHSAAATWIAKLNERLEEWRVRLRARWTRNVLDDADAVSRALVTAASNPEARHGPQAARVLLEGAGIIGGVRDVTINGDVDASTTLVDARRVQLVQSGDRAAQRERLAELERDLGIV